jgi:tetratricopeptide (TPR) repeat protein
MLPGACGKLGQGRGGRRARTAAIAHSVLAATLLLSWGSSAADDPVPSVPAEAPPPSDPGPAPPSAGAAVADAPRDPDDAHAQAASEAFEQASALYDQGRVAEALAQYERAYELVPAQGVLYNIGVLSYELERWAEARTLFERYMKLGGEPDLPERLQDVQRKLAELEKKTGTLTLNTNVAPDVVMIDSVPVRVREFSGLIVEPGERMLHVSKPGYRAADRVVNVGVGQNLMIVIELFPDAPPQVREQTAAPVAALPPPVVDRGIDPRWLCWGVTGALAIGWATTAALAIKARHDRDVIERPGTPAEDIDDAQRLHKTLAITSDVLLASTLVAGGFAAYFTWWDDDGRSTASAPVGAPARPRTAAEGWIVGFSGHF